MHNDKIRQFEWVLRLKMSKICIENRIFYFKLVLDTIFRASKSLEMTLDYELIYFIFRITSILNLC